MARGERHQLDPVEALSNRSHHRCSGLDVLVRDERLISSRSAKSR